MGFSFDVSVPILTVFLQGLLSFFSPCVLPLIPIYIGYLSGGTGMKGEDGRIYFKKSKVMLHTIFFVLGISFTFVLLGAGVSAFGSFFKENQLIFARIGGILVVGFGLYQLGVFGKSALLGKERRLPFKADVLAMSPVTAFLMGFMFSFAWTPCVGPALASVLLMSASAATKWAGFALIGVYALGFVLPFLIVGLFTTTVLEFFKNHMKVVRYTVKIGGVLMILMGVLMFTGKMNAFTGYLSGTTSVTEEKKEETQTEQKEEDTKKEEAEKAQEEASMDAIDFTLYDQYGEEHSLADYKGKTIFLNFWATWCPPCKAEMPDIQKLYESYGEDGEVAIVGVAAPNYGNETSEDGIKQFLEENGYTYPVLMDTEGELFAKYGIQSYPTTFMIDKEGKIFGYVSGQLTEDMMKSIINQTLEGKRQ